MYAMGIENIISRLKVPILFLFTACSERAAAASALTKNEALEKRRQIQRGVVGSVLQTIQAASIGERGRHDEAAADALGG